MQLERKYFRPTQLGKTAVAVVLLATILVSLLFSASPHLHEHLHHDAAQSSHRCAITIFEQQQLSVSNPSITVVELIPGLFVSVDVSDFTDSSEFDYRFSASRAPPSSLFSSPSVS